MINGPAGIADVAVYKSFDTVGVRDLDRNFHQSANTAYYLSEGNYSKNNPLPDFYRFEVEVFDEISISLTAGMHSGYMHMVVYDDIPESSFGYIENVDYITDGEIGALSFTAYTSGVYYLAVLGSVGRYNLSINGVRENPDKEVQIIPVITYLLM